MLAQSSKKEGPGKPAINLKDRAQVILGFIFAFIAILGLVIGIVRLWTWFNASYAHREVAYQTSRILAGQPHHYSDYGTKTYIDVGATSTNLSALYQPLNLSEDWLFQGKLGPLDKVGTFSGGDFIGPDYDQCKPGCQDQPGCSSGDNFDADCACYVKCVCLASNTAVADALITSAENLEAQAAVLRDNAEGLRDAAEDCDDPWEMCWWGDFGATAKKLKEIAREMDNLAEQTEESALELRAQAELTLQCCEYPTAQQQTACMNSAGGYTCLESIDKWIESWEEELGWLYEDKAQVETTLNKINEALPECASGAATICDSGAKVFADAVCNTGCGEWCPWCTSSEWQAYYNQYYNECYPKKRSCCCKSFYCTGEGSGTSCTWTSGEQTWPWSCATFACETSIWQEILSPVVNATVNCACTTYNRRWCWSRDCDLPSSDCDETANCINLGGSEANCDEHAQAYADGLCQYGCSFELWQYYYDIYHDACSGGTGSEVCPKCGLSTLAANLQIELDLILAQITELQEDLIEIEKCRTAVDCWDCILNVIK